MTKHALALIALVAACKNDASDRAAAPPARAVEVAGASAKEPAAAEVKKPAPTAATFGKAAAMPFGAAAKLKLGSSEADAKQAAPQFWHGDTLATVTSKDDGLAYKLDFAAGRLVKIEVTSPDFVDIAKLVETAWGPGIATTNRSGIAGKDRTWFAPDAGTRASQDAYYELVLSEYVPFDKLLGPDKLAIAALPKPILGATAADLARDYGPLVKTDGPVPEIVLPPTEWNSDHVTVTAMILERTGRVTDYSFTIDDAAHPESKDETIAAFTKKWGTPKLATSYGEHEPSMIFHKSNPLIQVQRDPGMMSPAGGEGWVVRVRPKDDACGGPCFTGL